MTPEEEKIAVAVATELVKQSYSDALQPPAKQVGKILEEVFKSIRLLFLPFRALAFLNDALDILLQEALKKVEENNRIMPPGQVVMKICQDFYTYNINTMAMQLISNLLARFIDKTRISEAHPAFLVIIPQLCDDEIRILTLLKNHQTQENKPLKLVEYHHWDDAKHVFYKNEIKECDISTEALNYPNHFFMYISHLYSLNLAGCWQYGNQVADLKNGVQIGSIKTSGFRLTDFGRLFCNACIG